MASPSIPPTMRAVQVTAYNKPYTLTTVPVPTDLKPHELLVKVAVASYCHTDGMVQSGAFNTKLPYTASHEGAGTVVLTGSAVTTLKPGDRVMCGVPLGHCGQCEECKSPDTQYCPAIEHVGVTTHGNFAEYVNVDERSTTLVPEGVSLVDAAPLACAGRTAWRALIVAGLEKGQSIALVGSGGGLGHFGIQFAKGLGLKVIGIDARDQGLALSKELGADVVVDARKGKEAVVEEVKRVTGSRGADASITLSDAEGASSLACAVTKVHGTMVQIAQPDEVKIPFQELIFRDVRIKSGLLCSPSESRDMLEVVRKNGIKATTKVYHGLEKVDELVQFVHTGALQGKAIVVVDETQLEK